MHVWTNVAAVRGAEPSPLLTHLAGEFADRIALIWPAPHTPFLAAGANQRHLIALGLSHGPAEADLRAVLEMPIKRALRALLPEAPNGLLRALGHIGETLWTAKDYGLLLAVLLRPEPAKALAHAPAIDPGMVRGLHRLPAPLALANLSHLGLNAEQSMLVAETFAAIEARDGVEAGRRVADRWARCRSVASLMAKAQHDVLPDLPPPPFPATGRLRPLATRAAINDAARRFDNCLRDQIHRAIDATSAFYEWTGEPGAVLEIHRDPLFGWRLEEARLRHNAVMPESARGALIDDLRAMGVRVGRTSWEIQSALGRATLPDFVFGTPEDSVRWRFEY